ncbi:large proline-rich protein BAG6-like [Melia azedarach]|uniref:Large proline-rich protein BAG6-like n=1 Tax=Melia azedarach TaxID=155640 RepID=A0ACC1X9F4_MELAZ|nr:large proline-rich protein BAG6-like [Melia azedarach]
MGSNSDDTAVDSSSKEAGCSDSTIEIKIKTMDAGTYMLRVNKHVQVLALKEQITTVTGVPSKEQRLLHCGRALQNDQFLSAYQVEEGHMLHLVTGQQIPSSSESSLAHPATNLASGASNNQSRQVSQHVTVTIRVTRTPAESRSLAYLNQIFSALRFQIPTTGRNNEEEHADWHSGPNNQAALRYYSRHGLELDVAASEIDFTIHVRPQQLQATISVSMIDLLQLVNYFGLQIGTGSSSWNLLFALRATSMQSREPLHQLERQLVTRANMIDPPVQMGSQTNLLSRRFRGLYVISSVGRLSLRTRPLQLGVTSANPFVLAGSSGHSSTSGSAPNHTMTQGSESAAGSSSIEDDPDPPSPPAPSS